LKAVIHTRLVASSADAIGGFNTGPDTGNLHRPTGVSQIERRHDGLVGGSLRTNLPDRRSSQISRIPQIAVAKRRSNRHIVPLHGKSNRQFTPGLKYETR